MPTRDPEGRRVIANVTIGVNWWPPLRRRLLAAFAAAERPAAWLLLVGGLGTFVAVAANLIATGVAKWATLLVAADLVVSGFGAVQMSDDAD
ncbi:MAG: hypothetical protein M3P34_00245 [Actinomycetota bacterium]|nr:hypothetical protein [Actinomycetota bacterium]